MFELANEKLNFSIFFLWTKKLNNKLSEFEAHTNLVFKQIPVNALTLKGTEISTNNVHREGWMM